LHEIRAVAQTLLFDHEHNLEERILKEQFQTWVVSRMWLEFEGGVIS
jgi:hypothetical protein